MYAKDILELCRRHDVHYRAFSQEEFRRSHSLQFHVGLCAALIQVWWQAIVCGGDGMATLLKPSPQLIESVIACHLRSFYFASFPPISSALDERTEAFLRLKYGDLSIAELHALCIHYTVRSPLELDLVLHHNAPIVYRSVPTGAPRGTTDALVGNRMPGLRLLILRHGAVDRPLRYGHSGHRLAFVKSAGGPCVLFDPSWGELRFETTHAFASCFQEFWDATGYQRLASHPEDGTPPVRIYQLGNQIPPSPNFVSVPSGPIPWERLKD